MVIKAEVVRGDAYILTEPGQVWRVKFGYDGQPIIELLDDVGHERARYLCETAFAKWANAI
jgi:hypothetical protein